VGFQCLIYIIQEDKKVSRNSAKSLVLSGFRHYITSTCDLLLTLSRLQAQWSGFNRIPSQARVTEGLELTGPFRLGDRSMVAEKESPGRIEKW
jgi:hypothetical protein